MRNTYAKHRNYKHKNNTKKTHVSKCKYLIKKYYRKIKYNSIAIFFICAIVMAIGLNAALNDDIENGTLIMSIGAIPAIPISILATRRSIYKINGLDMVNDLNCWGIRIIGAVLIFAAFLVGIMGSMIMILHFTGFVMMLFTVELIIVGAFAEYRSVRRYGNFVYLR
jgi:predicted permease